MNFPKKPNGRRAPQPGAAQQETSVLLSLRKSLLRMMTHSDHIDHISLESLVSKIDMQVNSTRTKAS